MYYNWNKQVDAEGVPRLLQDADADPGGQWYKTMLFNGDYVVIPYENIDFPYGLDRRDYIEETIPQLEAYVLRHYFSQENAHDD